MTITGGFDVLGCVVDGCAWTHTEPHLDPRINYATLGAVFGDGIIAAQANSHRSHRIEHAVRTHMETHTVRDWVTTIVARNATIEQLRAAATPS